jgi:diaminopimelate epimerase
MSLAFTKYHGLGNDFILTDARSQPELAHWPDLAIQLCNRHTGIGADGLVLVLPARDAVFAMHIFNSDGSIARMCGNGIRCFTRYVFDQGWWHGRGELHIQTASGLRMTEVVNADSDAFMVRVNMQPPLLAPADVPTTLTAANGYGPALDRPLDVGEMVRVSCLSMGNPHAVMFVDDLADVDPRSLGPRIETHPVFPDKTNVHFVQVIDQATLRMRTWERGAGLTLACGTGACAATVAAALTGRAGRKTTVYVPGGYLSIDWSEASGEVYMTGPVARVFDGVVAAELLGQNLLNKSYEVE